jgi:hypothetical protein
VVTNPTWAPIPGPQTDAFASDADELFYGGAAGGGKTDLLLGVALDHTHSIIYRREYDQLRSMIDRSRVIYRDGRFNGQEKQWRFSNGKTIEFGSVQYEWDVEKYQGRPHDLIGFDEITHFSETQYRFLLGWLRTTNPHQRTRVIATGNPPITRDGEWVKDYWSPWLKRDHPNPALPGELRWFAVIDGEDAEVRGPQPFTHNGERITPRSRTFIPARLEDNPLLDRTDYRARLQALPEPLRSQLLYGDFDATAEIPNRTYFGWSEENRIAVPYDPHRTVYIGLDFNRDPGVMIFGHELVFGEYPAEHHREGLRHFGWFGEIFIRGGIDIETLCLVALTGHDRDGDVPEGVRLPPELSGGLVTHQAHVRVDGDASGGARTMAASGNRSLWQQVAAMFQANLGRRFQPFWRKANPSEFGRVTAVNAKLSSTSGPYGVGVISLWNHPRCEAWENDMREVRNRHDAQEILKSSRPPERDPYALLTHISDAGGYVIEHNYPSLAWTKPRVSGAPYQPKGAGSEMPEI